MTKYKFSGDGACVPGLPLEISEEEVSQFNVEERQVLDAAVAAGVYVEVGEQKPEGSGQKAEGSGQKAEGRRQKPEGRELKFEEGEST